MNGREVELKLALAPEVLAGLDRLPLLSPHRRGRAITKHLRSVYYDTAGQHLAKAGITLRLRQSGTGGGAAMVQTVKTAGSRTSGVFSRHEWEVPVEGPGLDLGQLSATGLAPLRDPALLADLVPVFETHVRRTLHQLADADWQVELALDQGEVRAGARAAAISEVELELTRGSPTHLFALARQLAEHLPLRLMVLSKSDRGYLLAGGRGPAVAKAPPLALSDDATLAEGFRLIARNCLHHLLANEPALRQGDGEAVHQMRVALRRLRSALKVFRPLVNGPQLARLKSEIRWLMAYLGPARDTQVFLAEIVEPVVAKAPGRPGLAALHDHWRGECTTALAGAQGAVANQRFAIFLLDLGAWVEAGDWCSDPALPGYRHRNDPLRPFATKVLDRLRRKLRRAGRKRLGDLPPAALHKLRIRCKQMRYAAEFFAPLYPQGRARARDYLSALEEVQDRLGELNDIAVAFPRLAGCQRPVDAAWAAGLTAGWHEARRPSLVNAADASWAAFRQRRKFWDR